MLAWLIKEGVWVNLIVDTMHLKISRSSLDLKALLSYYLFFLSPKTIMLCPYSSTITRSSSSSSSSSTCSNKRRRNTQVVVIEEDDTTYFFLSPKIDYALSLFFNNYSL